MNYVSKGATFSNDARYRYHLWREWRSPKTTPHNHWHWEFDEFNKPMLDGAGEHWGEPLSVVFVMLNPSTADADLDDATIRRCVAFANGFGYNRIDVVNLFAHRTRNPREMMALDHTDDPVGHMNQRYVERVLNEWTHPGLIICAWGNHGTHLGQDETMLGWLREHKLHALRISKDGHPGHPLYLPNNSPLLEFKR